MLNYLNIRNFALIDNCEINFSPNLNIITGETGSGKSIIIQALTILLGGRASVEHIRTGMKEAVLNAEISLAGQKEIAAYLAGIGIVVEDEQLILRRILTASGKSRSYINGTPVTTKELAVISSHIFDFHGQHDGVSLLRKQTHIKYLDNFLNLEEEIRQLSQAYNRINDIKASLKELLEVEEGKEKRLELLSYEIEEIEEVEMKEGEDESLRKEIKRLENHEELTRSMHEVSSILGSDGEVLNRLKQAKSILDRISDSDNSYNSMAGELSDIYYKLEDISLDLNSRLNQDEYDQEKLDLLIGRSEELEKLKRKYGRDYKEISAYLSNARKELEEIKFSHERRLGLEKQLEILKIEYKALALAISEKRKAGALVLEKAVKDVLIDLAMENVEFKIRIDYEESENQFIEVDNIRFKYGPVGIDRVEFQISPNKGEPLKSLVKIASGGELSRIILSLKTVLVGEDSVNTMIFDEIDTGIGGKVALAVSSSLKNLAADKQIICITHLPQIAAAGNSNFLIHKEVVGDRTITGIDLLEGEAKVKEISRMLAGNITETSLSHAEELINSIK